MPNATVVDVGLTQNQRLPQRTSNIRDELRVAGTSDIAEKSLKDPEVDVSGRPQREPLSV